jgi:hypothetical protein
VESGQPWKIFHHAFSTKRDLLPVLCGLAAALNAKRTRSGKSVQFCGPASPLPRKTRSKIACAKNPFEPTGPRNAV